MSDDHGEEVRSAPADRWVRVSPSVDEGTLDDGSTVLLHVPSGALGQLDVIGSLMWRALRMAPSSVDELAADLADAFEQPPEVTGPAVSELVDRLEALGLIEASGSQACDDARPTLAVLPDPPSP